MAGRLLDSAAIHYVATHDVLADTGVAVQAVKARGSPLTTRLLRDHSRFGLACRRECLGIGAARRSRSGESVVRVDEPDHRYGGPAGAEVTGYDMVTGIGAVARL